MDAMTGLWLALVGIFGLVIGSFLNVVIYRVPRGESIASPGSRCPSCGAAIRGYDNVPVVSWLILRGHCRNCGAPISRVYPLIEASCALLFVATAARVGFHWQLPAFLVLVASLLALSIIDLQHLLLPRAIVWPTLAIVLVGLSVASAASHQWHRLLVGAICAAAWSGLFMSFNLANPRWMGKGDVRLALVLGLALGWLGIRYVILGFFAANVVGAVIGVALIAVGRVRRDQAIPFGVFLALGTEVAILGGSVLLSPFQGIH
jgi:leader peptidase (prepilin peptidase) / N-methyltransferase